MNDNTPETPQMPASISEEITKSDVFPPISTTPLPEPKVKSSGDTWSAFRELKFREGSCRISHVDAKKIAEVAGRIKRSSTMLAGLDGFSDPADGGLGERRLEAVRAELLKAGLASSRIETGAFGEPLSRREGRVGILTRSPR